MSSEQKEVIDEKKQANEPKLTFMLSSTTEVHHLKDPLIVTVGIGEYDSGVYPNLVGIKRDYLNIKYSLNFKRGYSMVYMTKNNKIKNEKLRITKNGQLKDNFKIRWTKKEIVQFNTSIIQDILKENKYDGLIYFLSGHGERDGDDDTVVDSNGTNLLCSEIISSFDSENCVYLKDLPKIFLFDCCRGSLRAKKEYLSQKTETTKDQENEDKEKEKEKEQGQTKETAAKQEKKEQKVKENDEEKNSKSKSGQKVEQVVHQQNALSPRSKASDIYRIYAGRPGFAVVDGGNRGGYLIRSFTKVIANDGIFYTFPFEQIILQTKQICNILIGSMAASVIDVYSTIGYEIRFTSKHMENNEQSQQSSSNFKQSDQWASGNVFSMISGIKPVLTCSMRAPLVAMIGISKYSEKCKLGKLTGVEADYVSMKYGFNTKWGYDMFYYADNDSDDKKTNSTNYVSKHITTRSRKRDLKDKYKMEWFEDDIDQFNDDIVEILSNDTKYDGLIYIISCHGGEYGSIFDSNGDEYVLEFVYYKFDNATCPQLRNKPKIFFINCQRGDKNDILIENKNKSLLNAVLDVMMPKTMKGNSMLSTGSNINYYINKMASIDDESKNNNESLSAIPSTQQGTSSILINYQLFNQEYYCKESNFRKIFATAAGYNKIAPSAAKGSYLLRSLRHILSDFEKNAKESKEKYMDLNAMIKQLQRNAQKMVTNANEPVQTIDDNNTMPYNVQLAPNLA